ncbi:hypothetical protein M407DRAFT_120528 [Tulasnella calospora MUT 4182]|uniref:Uncharacterized protein n=1 Tax=Tulasnella calospora MUT 4182 TaxID=1051891 RepID=A0A0C3QC72_9AGAM|nr:hypothetical protein M407DRAFT_120528 [Tulasnella calospora MUT 4182]
MSLSSFSTVRQTSCTVIQMRQPRLQAMTIQTVILPVSTAPSPHPSANKARMPFFPVAITHQVSIFELFVRTLLFHLVAA